MTVLHYWYASWVRGLIPSGASSPDSLSDSVIPSSSLAVLRSPRVIASSRGPGSLMPASAPLEEQEQFTVNSVQIAFWEGETLPQKVQCVKVRRSGPLLETFECSFRRTRTVHCEQATHKTTPLCNGRLQLHQVQTVGSCLVTCHLLGVNCHLSGVTCHLSELRC